MSLASLRARVLALFPASPSWGPRTVEFPRPYGYGVVDVDSLTECECLAVLPERYTERANGERRSA